MVGSEDKVLLTVVTITFNDLDGLKKTEQSIASQTDQGFEWIVIDGSSNGNTADYLGENERIDNYISERDRGIYDAMRKGWRLAAGDYVLFLNSGDYFNSDEVTKRLNAELGKFDVYFYSTYLTGSGRRYLRSARAIESARYSVPAVQQSTVYRKSVLSTIEWPETYKICGDYSIAAQLLARNSTSNSSSFVVSCFEIGGVSTTRFFALAFEAMDIQRRYLKIPLLLMIIYFARRLSMGLVVRIVHAVRISG